MSLGYAARLSEYPNKGVCGLPETRDSTRAVTSKVKRLATLMKEASQTVIITGAGISTAAGIPDFRGPTGVWTLEKESKLKSPKRKRPRPIKETPTEVDFAAAKPTICHRAITKLVTTGKVAYVITQNVDGLHRRAGLSREKFAAVHGCCFTAKCENCKAEFFYDEEVPGMSFQPTGKRCAICKGVLRDTLLDWEDPLPEDYFERCTKECEKPGTLVLCLGTSLRILPVGELPLSASKFAIVNLQPTPRDEQAALVIRGAADDVLNGLMIQLGMPNWQDEEPPPIERVWKPTKLPAKDVSDEEKEE